MEAQLNMGWFKKFASRKFLLVIIATILVWSFVFAFKDSNPELCSQALSLWAMIVGGYIGINGIQHIGLSWTKGKNNENSDT